MDHILLGYRSSMQSSLLYSPFELVYGVKASLPIEIDLPTHTLQQDQDGNHMEMLMENLKILGDKRSNAHKNIQQAQATQKRQYDRKHNRQGEFKVEGVPSRTKKRTNHLDNSQIPELKRIKAADVAKPESEGVQQAMQSNAKGRIAECMECNETESFHMGDCILYLVGTKKSCKKYGPAVISQVCHLLTCWSKEKIQIQTT